MTLSNHSFSYYYQGLIVPLFILAPIGVALFKFNSISKPIRILLLYLVVSGGINLLAIFQSGSNNLPLLHIYTIIEFLMFMAYFLSINLNKIMKRWSYILLVMFPLLCVFNVLFLQSRYQFNSYVRPLEAIILIFYCLYYFIYSIKEDHDQSWAESSLNWINAGILLYFSSALFLFIFSNVISVTLSHATKMMIWNLHDSFVLVLYLLFALGFSKCKSSEIIYTS